MRNARLRARGRAEDGAVAVIAAITLTVLLLMAALVLDLGLVRADRVEGKAVADMAATAAIVDYDSDADDSALAACQEAIAFAEANLGGEAQAITTQSCADIYTDYGCTDGVAPAQPAAYEIAGRDIEVLIPVPDDHPLMEGLSHDERDGESCDRVGVRVRRDRSYLLAGVAGFDGTTTLMGSVALSTGAQGSDAYASLVVLKREGCDTLHSVGNSQIEVLKLTTTEDDEPIEYPGAIMVDTLPDGNCVVMRQQGTSEITADGDISLFALNDNSPAESYTPSSIDPTPQPGPLLTRSIVDHRYNCQTGGYSPGAPYDPTSAQPIDDCPQDGDEPPPPTSYIKDLHDGLVADDPWDDAPTEWTVINNCNNFDLDNHEPNVYFNCHLSPADVTLTGVENVVIEDGIRLNNSDHRFEITGASGTGANLVIRSGDIRVQGGQIRLQNVFTYHVSGHWSYQGNPDGLVLQAPLAGETGCSITQETAGSVPEAACFSPLAYWSNDTGVHDIRGDATGGIIGTVFMPNSKLDMQAAQDSGSTECNDATTWGDLLNSLGTSLNLESAQILANEFQTRGGSTLRLCPSPSTTIPMPAEMFVGLIR